MHFRRTILYALGLALAMGGPISLFSASNFATKLRKPSTGVTARGTVTPQPASGVPQTPEVAPPDPPPLPAPSTPMPSLAEVLSFDVSVDWIIQRWPRVSTGLPHLQLQGYRVPLVSGTSLQDVAGSLTYYFNATQQVDRIALRGKTGDPAMLVTILATRHHFTRRLTNDPGLVLYEAADANARPVGVLKIRSASTVEASKPFSRFDIDLVMDRPE
ncbi:MAG: DUF6690 family protein [Thermoguttaceae bacterium]